MTTELFWLVLSILLTAILWLPYIINRLAEQGFFKALW
ncbi:MAG TPA: MAPEG family protein, partial [Thiothrix sp.]|nr:MAPEG family protein [Thiothrix sp.]